MYGAASARRAGPVMMLTLALALGGAAAARADSWGLPQKQTYHSPNKRFAFEVTPKKLESQLSYFSDKVDGKPDAGAVKGLAENYCKGVLFEQRGDGPVRRAAFRLVNEVAPVGALVADSGRYVVTFDNWHSVGYGGDVVVIYLGDGTLVGKLGLADFLTEKDVMALPRSVSSIWWGGEHYLDEPAGQLVLRVVADRGAQAGKPGRYQELRVGLATGRPVEPKRDLLPELHPRLEPVVVATPPGGVEE